MLRLRLACLATACLVGCSGGVEDQRPLATEFDDDATFAWEAYDRTGAVATLVDTETGYSTVRVHLDCFGAEGDVRITTGAGDAEVPCPVGGRRHATVEMGTTPPEVMDGPLELEIEPPSDARWSAAVALE